MTRLLVVVLMALASADCRIVSERPPDSRAPVTLAQVDLAGDDCETDAQCAWDDSCMPASCVDAATVTPSPACEETAPPPGTCTCVDRMCTLRPDDPGRGASAEIGCTSDAQCAVDVSNATCHLNGYTLIGPIAEQGPVCLCDEASGLCRFEWVGPVACESFRDCWYEREPRLRPVRATEPREAPVTPCVDGEVDSVCGGDEGEAKTCRVVSWPC